MLLTHGASLALLYAPFETSKVEPTLNQVYDSDSLSSNKITSYECDITSPDSVTHAFSRIAKENPAFPSILINAAGYVNLSPLEDTTPEDILRHYHINLYGPTLTGQAFFKTYTSRLASTTRTTTSPPPPGRIINIASQAAHVALHHHGAYCASKAGLIGLTKCMASEWGPHGITANSISPGPVWTELGKKAWADPVQREEYQKRVPTGRFAEPEEVAGVVEFLVGDGQGMVNGVDVRLDGGFTAR